MPASVETPNDLMVVFSDTVTAGFSAVQGSVNGVFGLMIALVVALTGIQWALSAHRDILAAGFGKVLLIGAFAWLINDWQQLSQTLYSGFLELGLVAGGGSLTQAEFLNPGAVLAQGWDIVKALGQTPAPVDNPLDVVGNLSDGLILGLAMIGIMLAFALLSLQIIVSLIEFKIVTLGGFVLLPFGIWTRTAFLAERPLGYVASSGLKVLALAIVISGAQSIFSQLQPSENPDIYEALSLLVASLILAMLALLIPQLAASLVTGGPSLGAGAAVTGAMAVGASGLLAGAAANRMGVALAGGSARLASTARLAAEANNGRSGPPGTPPTSGPTSAGRATSGLPTRGTSSRSGAGFAAARAQGEQWGEHLGKPGGEPAASPHAMTQPSRAQVRPSGPGSPDGTSPTAMGRSAAFRAYMIANMGRNLMPSAETSGALSPNLRTEER